jgi:malonyl-CoA O-methyltransferase
MSPRSPDSPGLTGPGLETRALRRAFNRAGASYERAAKLQGEARAELLARLNLFSLQPTTVLDLGAGTGAALTGLQQRYPRARLIAVDVAEQLLQQARRRGRWWRRPAVVGAHAYALPLQDRSIDLVFSNLMLQWCDQPLLAFAEIQRVLRPGGLLMFSSFGPSTLMELRQAWQAADDLPHLSDHADLPELAGAMTAAGLKEPVLDRDTWTRHYADTRSLMQELRELGAVNARSERRRSLTGKSRMKTMMAAYERQRVAAGLPATYELIFGAAFAGDTTLRHQAADEVAVPVGAIRRRGARPL